MLFFQVFNKKANELSVLMIFFHLPQKAKSMQPRDFEDDLASSAERFAKKKKKLEMDRLKSTETTPCNSPLLGAVLVEDTQQRGSPFPVYIYPHVIKSFLT